MTETSPNQTSPRNLGTPGAGDPDADRRRRDVRPLQALLPYLLKYRGMLAMAGVFLMVAAAATLAVPLAVRRMIDFGFSSENEGFIDRYFAMLMLVGLVLAIASAARFYFVTWLGERVVADLRTDVFRKLTHLSPEFYEVTHSGEVMSRLTADTTQIKSAVGSAFSQALRNVVLFIGAMVMMFVTSPRLSMFVLLAIPVVLVPILGYGRVVRRLSRTAQDTLARGSAYAAENLGALRTMQAYTSEDAVADRFGAESEQAFESARQRIGARAGLTAVAIFLVFASVVGIMWYAASGVLSGQMSSGQLGQFVLYAVFCATGLAALSEVWGEIAQAAGATERLTELLGTPSRIVSPCEPVALPQPPRGALAFEDVSFRYPSRPDDAALERVSFAVEPGETVAVVGASGAGKSTVLNLALRFYDPRAGAVLVDGVDARTADLVQLRRRFALVPQDVALFADTIMENIRYGAPGASERQVEEAAKAAIADDFIREMPQGYDTRLGERGVTLSGGQRQRIAIARAILRDAPILLLDEATSALDAENERLVQKALERVMQGRTTLVIAHRLATVQRADRILVFDRGRIIEQGTHDELLSRDGVYARLARLQFVGASKDLQSA